MALVLFQDADPCSEEKDSYERLKCDTAVSVSDLQASLERFFVVQDVRNIQEILDEIDNQRANWKTAPQATTHTPTTPFSFRSRL